MHLETIRDYKLADWKYEKIMKEIFDFEQQLDDQHEIALNLASFGSNILLNVVHIEYQNPDILYFFGYVNGTYSQLIQHVSQLNFLLTSVPKDDPTKPPRRIGFQVNNEEK